MVCLSVGAIKADLSHFQQVHICKQQQLLRCGCSLFSYAGNCAIGGKKCSGRRVRLKRDGTRAETCRRYVFGIYI